MKKKIISWFAFILVFAALPAYAAEVVHPGKNDPNVVVGAQQSHKNLYAVGGQVTVNSDTKEDLTAAGGMVTVSGNVEKEALIAGGNLNISGNVGSTMRFAGGNINISGTVGGDLVGAGGNISISGKSAVAGDLMVAGGNVIVDAPVTGNVKIAGGSVTINSKISGTVEVMTSKQLTFGPGAQIAGSINYKGPQAAVVDPAAKISEINFTLVQVKNYKPALAGLFTLGLLIKLLAWLIAGWVVVHFKKNFVTRLNQEFRLKPWENLGLGFAALVTTPIAVILLLVTLVGYYLAIMLGLAYILTLVSAALFASIVLGYFLLSLMNKSGEAPSDWQAIVIGVVAWMVLSFIPVIGWLCLAVMFLMVLGAGVKLLKRGSNQ